MKVFVKSPEPIRPVKDKQGSVWVRLEGAGHGFITMRLELIVSVEDDRDDDGCMVRTITGAELHLRHTRKEIEVLLGIPP